MSGIQYFPQTLPPNTVVGRLASGSGPTEAVPLAALAAALSLGNALNVVTYGADPTGVADSAAAFTAAGNAYSTIFVPSGAYNLSSSPTPGNVVTWLIANNATFTGVGVLPGAQLAFPGTYGSLSLRHDYTGTTTGFVGGLKVGICAANASGWTGNPATSNWVAHYPYITSTGRNAIWASNPVTDVILGADATAWGEEVNINNASTQVTDPEATLKKVGIDIVSGGGKQITAAMRISASLVDGTNWHYNGLYVTRCTDKGIWFRKIAGDSGVAFANGAVQDTSDSYASVYTPSGSHTYGVDLNGATFSQSAIRIPSNKALACRNNAAGADILLVYANANDDLVLGGSQTANSKNTIIGGLTVIPDADNDATCGKSGERWSAVWAANGTIQTSDPKLKTNIAELPSMVALVNAVKPRTYQWIEGGKAFEDAEEEQLVPDEEITFEAVQKTKLVDGRAVAYTEQVERRRGLFDVFPVQDDQGNPVTVRQLVINPKWPAKGEPKHIEADVPLTHHEPRMVKKMVKVKKLVSVPGKRTHWGFLAPDFKAAMDGIKMDFGGYVLGEDGTASLRPDQLVPILWKAVQELSAKLDALTPKTA